MNLMRSFVAPWRSRDTVMHMQIDLPRARPIQLPPVAPRGAPTQRRHERLERVVAH